MNKVRRLMVLAGIAAAVSAVLAPAAAGAEETIGQTPEEEPPAQVILSGRVDVPAGRSAGEVIIFHGPARIAGQVQGDVIVFDGATEVSGLINGDVVSFNGPVLIGRGGHVTGDLRTREEPTVEEGAVVDGEQGRVNGSVRPLTGFLARFAWWIPISLSVLALGLVLLLVAPRGADAVFEAGRYSPGASFGWGVAVLVGLPVAGVIALVTLVGVPFGLGLFLAFGLLYATGYTWGAWLLGRSILGEGRSRVLSLLAGWAILRLLGLIPFVGGVVGLAATVLGFGAAAVAIWRARRGAAPSHAPKHRPGAAETV